MFSRSFLRKCVPNRWVNARSTVAQHDSLPGVISRAVSNHRTWPWPSCRQQRWIGLGVPVILQSPMPRSTVTGKYSPENLAETTIEARLDKVVVSPTTNSIQCSIHVTSPNLVAPARVQVDIGLDAIQHAFKTSPTPGSTTAAILPVASQCLHPHPPPLTASTATSTLPTVTPTNNITRTDPNPETARALRFIQFYTDDTGHHPRVHILADGQYCFDAEQIAAFYSPNLKHPRDAVKRHLSRWIGCSDGEANGIRLVGKTVVGTIDALLDKLVAKMRSTRKDVAFRAEAVHCGKSDDYTH